MMISRTISRLALGVAVIGLAISPLAVAPAMAQDAPAAPPAATEPAVPGGQPAPVISGPSSGAEDQVKDEDVFGFDITMGTANLTDEQRLAARNTCNEKVMTDATRYSGAVRTFCQQLQ